MKKITLALAALVAFGAANAQETKKLICKANFDAAAVALNQPHYLGVNGDGNLQMTNTIDESALWTITENADGSYYIASVGLDGWLYAEDGANRTLEYSETPVYIVDSPEINGAVGFTTTANAATNQNVFLNISGQTGMIAGWSLDRGSSFFILDYVEGDTDETVQNRVQGMLLRDYAVERMTKYCNSSTSGQELKEAVLAQINEAIASNDLTDLQLTYNNWVNRMVEYFITDLQGEAMLFNNGSGNKYFSYRNGDEAKPFRMEDTFSTYGLWRADVMDNIGMSAEGEMVRFRLQNVESGEYIAKQPTNNVPVTATTNIEDAAVYRVSANALGFAIRGVNVENDVNYLNIAQNDFLCIWNKGEDNNSIWYTRSLSQFSENDIEVSLGGEASGEDIYEMVSINSIQIKVRKGATPSIGTAKIYVYDESGKDVEISSKKVAELLEGVTPTDGQIEIVEWVEEWNEEYQMNIPVQKFSTVDVDVYEVALETPITEPGEYHVELSVGSFSTTIDGAELYSPIAAGYSYIATPTFQVVVGPEAGSIKEITEITFDYEGGLVANPAFADYEDLKLTKLVETFLFDDPDMGPIYEYNEVTLWHYAPDQMAQFQTYEDATGEGHYYTIPVNLTEPGEYTLIIPDAFFVSDEGINNQFSRVTWTIEAETGINTITNVKVNGQTIYDIQGRRMAAPVKGINIINGKKVLVK